MFCNEHEMDIFSDNFQSRTQNIRAKFLNWAVYLHVNLPVQHLVGTALFLAGTKWKRKYQVEG